ncbi:MAG: TRAP transporter large permease subunit [Peptococcaceae bacterium]|nr:TRAP transporter large permease subunit [Peptococcaceae bacterium]MDH7526185.1 TRAP transporter large permease subunit [Peptococcaceae bacterium]
MDWQITFVFYIAILFTLLALGQWIAFALGTTGLIGLYLLGGIKEFQAVGILSWNMINSFELTAVPLFIFMGEVLLRTGLSDKFYKGASMWFNRLPGGLLQTNIISCMVFAAVSGSSVATAATIGSVALPELSSRGYNHKLIFGSIGGGGALGILIPPSIPMIVYGSMVSESVAKLFMAGLIPGILAGVIFMVYLGVRCIFNPSLVPPREKPSTLKEKIMNSGGMLYFAILVAVILGGIYWGITTPTEAAAIGASLTILMSLLSKTITWANFKESVHETVKTTSMIMFIIIGAQILSYLIVKSGINRALSEWIVAIHPSVGLFLTIIIIVYLVLGCLIDGLSMIFLTIPILWPMIKAMGINPVWFAVILVILIEIAQITPPVGLNIYVLHGISGRGSISEVIKGIAPFTLLYMLVVLLVIMFPALALWLPSNMPMR